MNYARICLTVYLNPSHVCASIVSHLLRDSGQITVVTHTDLIDRNYEPRYSQTSQYPWAEMCYVNNTVTYESTTHLKKTVLKYQEQQNELVMQLYAVNLGFSGSSRTSVTVSIWLSRLASSDLQFLLKTISETRFTSCCFFGFFLTLINESTFHVKSVIMPAADFSS